MVMAHGLNSTVMKRGPTSVQGVHKAGAGDTTTTTTTRTGTGTSTKTGIGSRRIFPPHFKLQVLDSYRNDADCKGNQRATARKYGIHRRQIQKWLQAETNLRSSVIGVPVNSVARNNNNKGDNHVNVNVNGRKSTSPVTTVANVPMTKDTIACNNDRKSVCGVLVPSPDFVALERHRQRDDLTTHDAHAAAAYSHSHHQHLNLKHAHEYEQEQDEASATASTTSPNRLSPVVLSPRPPLDCTNATRCPSTPADIVSPASTSLMITSSMTMCMSASLPPSVTAANALMPIDLSVKRPLGASSAPVSQSHLTPATATQSLPHPTNIVAVASEREHIRRARSRSPHQTRRMTATPTHSHNHCHNHSPPLFASARTRTGTAGTDPEIWDLSTHGHAKSTTATAKAQNALELQLQKPLFKPYLLDENERHGHEQKPLQMHCNNNTIIHNNNYEYTYMNMNTVPPKLSYYTPSYHTSMAMYENMDVGYVYDESGVLQPATYLRHQLPLTQQHQQQQRQSYSLDFKLRAIDCYYQDDSSCKGNQRAVAHKFNIHRRQVQKWLQQEDELRERQFVSVATSSSTLLHS